MVTSPHNRNCREDVGRVHGVSGEVCWGVGGGERSCGKRHGVCGGRCRERQGKMCGEGVGEGTGMG